ncbi:radical SAM protein [Candidatus Woesearchaeota archaeon]|nr:radical SAM protein [Candidatus Woesearchaeota archaeon]
MEIERQVTGTTRPGYTVAESENAQLKYLHGNNLEETSFLDGSGDPRYFLYIREEDKGILAVIGLSHLVESVHHYDISGEKPSYSHPLLSRANAYGNFRSYNGRSVDELMDYVNNNIRHLRFAPDREQERNCFLDVHSEYQSKTQQDLARFGDAKKLYTSEEGEPDIIPEFTDLMIPVKAGQGCIRACIYCDEKRKKFRLYPAEKIRRNIGIARDWWNKHHPHRPITHENELFINTPDILYFELLHSAEQKQGRSLGAFEERLYRTGIRGVPSAGEVVRLMREGFPGTLEEHFGKMYFFVGTPTTLEVPLSSLEDICKGVLGRPGAGANRPYIGFESLDDPTSEFLNKDETAAQKKEALDKLHKAGFPKVKIIMQLGMTGRGFYDKKGDFNDSLEAAAGSAETLAGMLGKMDNVQISVNRVLDPCHQRKIAQGMIIPFEDPEEVQEHVEVFRKTLFERWHKTDRPSVEDDYIVALENHQI